MPKTFSKIYRAYGDTDSIKITGIPPWQKRMIEFVGEFITKKMVSFCDKYNVKENLFLIRPEDAFDSFFLSMLGEKEKEKGRRKSYAGHEVLEYKEKVGGAEWREVDSFHVTGFERSEISTVGMEIFLDLIKMICKSVQGPNTTGPWGKVKPPESLFEDLTKYMQETKKKYVSGQYKLYDMCSVIKATQNLNEYGRIKEVDTKYGKIKVREAVPAQIKAAEWSNEFLKTRFGKWDKIPWIYVKSVPVRFRKTAVVAVQDDWTFDNLREFKIVLDFEKMFDKEIINKIEPVLMTIGYSVTDIVTGTRQGALDDLLKTTKINSKPDAKSKKDLSMKDIV
jgi:hypothetical protein